MSGIERISELRALVRVAADRAQATLARSEAGRKKIQAEISALTGTRYGTPCSEDPLTYGQQVANWDRWRQVRIRELTDALAASTRNCILIRARTAKLEAKVRAIDRIAARDSAEMLRRKRSRAARDGMPEP